MKRISAIVWQGGSVIISCAICIRIDKKNHLIMMGGIIYCQA